MNLNITKYQEGLVLKIDKPLGWTSFDVIKKIRVTLKYNKIGHAGTLDPLASGLLIVCTGKFTKRIHKFQEFDKEYYYNLSIVYDTQTKMVSLKEQVKPELMFNHTYAHRASQSHTMMNAFKKLAKYLDKNFRPKLILEIGSNDGVFIRNFEPERVVAVEPCNNLAEITNEMGYKTYPKFWDTDLAYEIVREHGKYDIIYSASYNTVGVVRHRGCVMFCVVELSWVL